ncbi:unnamed protein product [Knipowitschia caucasica]
MASRKLAHFPGKRTGVRSQKKMSLPKEEDVNLSWDTDEEDCSPGPSTRGQPVPAGVGEELLDVMRSFLQGQQRREETMMAELQGLRSSLSERRPEPPSASSSTWTAVSPRIDLPTPAPRQRPPSFSPTDRRPSGDGGQSRRQDARSYGDPKIPPYQSGEDIENYLLRFERIARTWAWPEDEWACRLVPLLSGKALEAYSAMDEDSAHSYPDLKEALLAKFDISPETYRRQFRSTTVPPGENPAETYHRLKGLYRRWIRPEEHTKEEIGDAIILEQFLRVLPGDIQTWVMEHEPKEGLAAAKLTQQYINARKGARQPTPPPRFPRREGPTVTAGNPSPAGIHQGTGKELICFYCQQLGHKASLCPIRKAKLSGACYVPRSEKQNATVAKRYKTVTVNGQTIEALLDSGSSMSLVREEFVPVNALEYGKCEDIICVHGDKHPYPTAELTVAIDGQTYLLTVRVVASLPVPALLGCDLPILLDLLMDNDNTTSVKKTLSCTVVTRAQAQTKAQSPTGLDHGLQVVDALKPQNQCSDAQPFASFEDSVFEGGTKGPKKSRRQRRFEKRLVAKQPDKDTVHKDLWEIPGNISDLQKDDCTLKSVFAKVGKLPQLGISAIKTTPYHPQTDGLVERFNQTLKKMLRKFVADTGKDWDRWLPFLLFAYREVPQASTGFSPFELLYGWDVQGPLDLLRKEWESPAKSTSDQSIVQYVLEMRERLVKYQEEATHNLTEAQRSQKTWYDQQARHREFQPGQRVLLLPPSSNSKLLAKWQGPYIIIRKMGPVTYEVHHPDKKKVKQTYHVNLLKEWKEREGPVASLLVQHVRVPDGEEEDTGAEGLPQAAEPVLAHLTRVQAVQLLRVFDNVPSLFAANPGKTTLVEHVIRLKEGRPIRQRAYRVPQHLVEKLKKEVEEMQKLGVIEPSNSEWCRPVVIVLKKDGSLRICIDFGKINAVSEFDAYPMPRIDELLERIGRAQYITTLDLCKGY